MKRILQLDSSVEVLIAGTGPSRDIALHAIRKITRCNNEAAQLYLQATSDKRASITANQRELVRAIDGKLARNLEQLQSIVLS